MSFFRRFRPALSLAAALAFSLPACSTVAGGISLREEAAAGPAPETGRERVVLLHGMRRTGRSMEKMARSLRREGYDTIVCSYPSRWDVHTTATNVFAALRPVLERPGRVHFVTHSLGGILVRDAFRDGARPADSGRVVMLSPPNGGCEHVDRFAWLPFFGFFWGTPARELGTGPESFPNRLPPVDFDCGVIAGTKRGLLGLLLPGPNDGKVTVARTRAEGVPEVLELPVNHTWMMRDDAVIAATARYLATGRFDGESGSRRTAVSRPFR